MLSGCIVSANTTSGKLLCDFFGAALFAEACENNSITVTEQFLGVFEASAWLFVLFGLLFRHNPINYLYLTSNKPSHHLGALIP